jgi:hypothetical protein
VIDTAAARQSDLLGRIRRFLGLGA